MGFSKKYQDKDAIPTNKTNRNPSFIFTLYGNNKPGKCKSFKVGMIR